MAALRGVDEAHEVNIMKYPSELDRISLEYHRIFL